MYIHYIRPMNEPIIESVAEVRAHLADSIDRARRDATPTIITRRGRQEAVILDLDEYKRLKEVEEAAEDAWLSRLAAASMAEGTEPSVTLEEMAAELLRREA